MKVILMRHGQTDCNKNGIWMGRKLDESINDTGREQIVKTIPELKALNPELIIASPMKRTKESAEIIQEALGIPIEFDERIVEIDIGSLSGKSREEAATFMSLSMEEAIHLYRVGEYDYTSLGGESFQHILERTQNFLKDLSQRKEKCVIVMAHGGLVRSLHRVITGSVSLVNEGVANGALIVLEYA
ncbi:MAG: histidine phosphatase family protein [Candidatus Colwellbacteria bacterium]|nr:histidine phosphatase family protein [Candidatus Colwellbacteria bacterium]